MAVLTRTDLVNDPEARKEIERYKWIESEKLGQDIGFDRAAKEWIDQYSKAWLKVHTVAEKKPARKAKKV
jgi:hypothetical protein